jgi:hypothetical protein
MSALDEIRGQSAESPPGAVWTTLCAWCGRRRVGARWLDAAHVHEPLASPNVEPLLTHGICPSCFDRAARAAERHRRMRDAS